MRNSVTRISITTAMSASWMTSCVKGSILIGVSSRQSPRPCLTVHLGGTTVVAPYSSMIAGPRTGLPGAHARASRHRGRMPAAVEVDPARVRGRSRVVAHAAERKPRTLGRGTLGLEARELDGFLVLVPVAPLVDREKVLADARHAERAHDENADLVRLADVAEVREVPRLDRPRRHAVLNEPRPRPLAQALRESPARLCSRSRAAARESSAWRRT